MRWRPVAQMSYKFSARCWPKFEFWATFIVYSFHSSHWQRQLPHDRRNETHAIAVPIACAINVILLKIKITERRLKHTYRTVRAACIAYPSTILELLDLYLSDVCIRIYLWACVCAMSNVISSHKLDRKICNFVCLFIFYLRHFLYHVTRSHAYRMSPRRMHSYKMLSCTHTFEMKRIETHYCNSRILCRHKNIAYINLHPQSE